MSVRFVGVVRVSMLLCVLLTATTMFGAELKVMGNPAKSSVSVVRRVDLDYYLLTDASPLEFEVDAGGDTAVWLRVYTRLWWPSEALGRQRYSLSLWRGDLERPYEFETGLSATSRAAGGRRVGEWRSFFVQVPAGRSRLRLALDSSRAETVGVRFVFRAPRPWRPLELAGFRQLELALSPDDKTEVKHYYDVPAGGEVRFVVAGPCRIRLKVRLSYDAALLGKQAFQVTVSEGGRQLARRVVNVSRSLTARFLNAADRVPSSEGVLRLDLPAGEHRLSAVIDGMLARSAAVAIEVLIPEKYE